MKRILFEFGTGKLIPVKDDVTESEIDAYMKLNKYRVMYIWFNDKTKGDNV